MLQWLTTTQAGRLLLTLLISAVHYLIIEITRRVRSGDVNQHEPVE